jgi:hypothetical protein
MPAPRIPIGIAQYAPLIPPMIAPTTPVIAQTGENAPAIALGNMVIHPIGFLVWIRSKILTRSDRPEKM